MKQYGVLVPTLVRPKPEGGYEMGVSAIFSINRRAESFDISRGKTRQNFEATMDAIVRLLALKA